MDEIAIALAIGISFAVIFALGELIFRRLTSRVASRLLAGWQWLVLPATAIVSFGAFLAIRPLVLDQPPSLPVLVGLVIAVALLITAATATAFAVLRVLGIEPADD